MFVDAGPDDFRHDDLFLIDAPFGEISPLGRDEKTLPPKFKSRLRPAGASWPTRFTAAT